MHVAGIRRGRHLSVRRVRDDDEAAKSAPPGGRTQRRRDLRKLRGGDGARHLQGDGQDGNLNSAQLQGTTDDLGAFDTFLVGRNLFLDVLGCT